MIYSTSFLDVKRILGVRLIHSLPDVPPYRQDFCSLSNSFPDGILTFSVRNYRSIIISLFMQNVIQVFNPLVPKSVAQHYRTSGQCGGSR